MSWYGDPEVLDAHARRVAADADGVRSRARALHASLAQLGWQGAAARAFRTAVEQDVDDLHRAAAELDEAAAALRAHAAQVRARLARIRALERAVHGWFEEQARALADALVDPIGAARRVLTDPPWSGWAWRPGTLPGRGDRAWLDVGADLRARGVRL